MVTVSTVVVVFRSHEKWTDRQGQNFVLTGYRSLGLSFYQWEAVTVRLFVITIKVGGYIDSDWMEWMPSSQWAIECLCLWICMPLTVAVAMNSTSHSLHFSFRKSRHVLFVINVKVKPVECSLHIWQPLKLKVKWIYVCVCCFEPGCDKRVIEAHIG